MPEDRDDALEYLTQAVKTLDGYQDEMANGQTEEADRSLARARELVRKAREQLIRERRG